MRSRRTANYTVEVTTGMGVPASRRARSSWPTGLQSTGMEVSTGNPHFVIVVDNAEFTVAGQRVAADRRRRFASIPIFPIRPTWNSCASSARSEIEIRIFERGVGPTTSSGTGTSRRGHGGDCAARLPIAAHGRCSRRRADRCMERAGTELYLTGPASLIARGEAWSDDRTAQAALRFARRTRGVSRRLSRFHAAAGARGARPGGAARAWVMRRSLGEHARRAARSTLPARRSMRLSDLHQAFADDEHARRSSARAAATARTICSTAWTSI